MKSRSGLFMLLVIGLMLVLAACGGAAATQAPPEFVAPATQAPATQAPAMADVFSAQESVAKNSGAVPQDQVAAAAGLVELLAGLPVVTEIREEAGLPVERVRPVAVRATRVQDNETEVVILD